MIIWGLGTGLKIISVVHFWSALHCIQVFLCFRSINTQQYNISGKVLMLTTPDNPYIVLPLLQSRGSALQGLLSGYYKLTGDQVSLTDVVFCTAEKSIQHCFCLSHYLVTFSVEECSEFSLAEIFFLVHMYYTTFIICTIPRWAELEEEPHVFPGQGASRMLRGLMLCMKRNF